MSVPPKLVRRLVIAPLVVGAEVALALLSPLLLLVAAALSPLFGGWRPLRAVLIVLAGTTRHMAAIVACFGLWVASGFGLRLRSAAMQRRHLALMRWFVRGLYDTIVVVADVHVAAVESAAAGEVLSTRDRPVLLLGRHAGEGDTLLVIYELLCPHGRGPRIVMHERLRLDPLVDMLGERLPNRFVDPRGGDTEHEIAEMAAALDRESALVIFPEGQNFSPEHRQRAIDRLAEAGHERQAAMAAQMRAVSAPRPGGTLAAIEAAPDADIVVLGHRGFPHGVRDVWRQLPHRQVIEVRMWHEPAASVPADRDAQIDWLYERWQAMDAWVADAPPGPDPSDPVR